MLKEFYKTLMNVIELRSIVGYNGLVYALRMTPVIGKIIPDALYKTTFLKIIYWMIHLIKEFFRLFIGKIVGLGAVYLIAYFMSTEYMDYGQAEGISKSVLFGNFSILFFMIYAICGLMIGIPMFRCTTEKEYLVFMLRMNARKLNNTLFIYDLAKLFIGYLIVGVIAAIAGAPVWTWLGIPFLALFIKLFGAGFQAKVFRSKSKHHKPMRNSSFMIVMRFVLAMILLPIVFVVVINGIYIPTWGIAVLSGIFILLGIWGYFELDKFNSNYHRRALHDNIGKPEIDMKSKPDNTKQFKKLKVSGTVKSNKKGFEYLNVLFMQRHKSMIVVKPIVITCIIALIAGIFMISFINGYHDKFGTDNTLKMVFSNFINMILFRKYDDPLMPYAEDSIMDFFRYVASSHLLAMVIPISIADISFKATQAMYINCDNSLMTFSFFKQRDKIIKLFDIRLKQLIKINSVPAIATALFANLFLFYTGGQDYPFQYLVTILVAILMCVFNSITCLALYYLFQPFTTTVNIKSGAYLAIRTVISLISIQICWIPLKSYILAAVLFVLCVPYVFFFRKLVYKKAPKTWRVKS